MQRLETNIRNVSNKKKMRSCEKGYIYVGYGCRSGFHSTVLKKGAFDPYKQMFIENGCCMDKDFKLELNIKVRKVVFLAGV